jgi:hypothetical protein
LRRIGIGAPGQVQESKGHPSQINFGRITLGYQHSPSRRNSLQLVAQAAWMIQEPQNSRTSKTFLINPQRSQANSAETTVDAIVHRWTWTIVIAVKKPRRGRQVQGSLRVEGNRQAARNRRAVRYRPRERLWMTFRSNLSKILINYQRPKKI